MRHFAFLLILFFISCATPEKEYSGEELLEKSIKKHDPKNQWNSAEFTLRIQEPRLQNPERFSLIYMNNQNNAFKLLRNRGEKIASYGINHKGIITVLLENKSIEDSDSLTIKKYMLQPERVKIYQNSYQTMLGLPMSLNQDLISKIGAVSKTTFDGRDAYKINIDLKRKVFSKYWNVYLSSTNFTLLGIDLVNPNDAEKGERLYFDKSIQIGDVSIPRMKHWYDLKGEYLGSDVIVKNIE